MRGTAAIDCFRPTRSRGPAVPSAVRATRRSRSWTLFSSSRNLPRSVLRNANSSTASSRSRMRSSETSGRSSHARSRRPAHRRHRAVDLVQQRSVAPAVHRFDHFQVAERDGVDEQAVGGGLEAIGSARARGRPSACRADSGAARRRPHTAAGMAFEAESLEAGGVELIEERRAAPTRARTSMARRA